MTKTSKLPKFKDIIGLYAEDYTEQEIDEYCEKVEACHYARSDGELLFMGVNIIRQLQKPILLNPEVAVGVRHEREDR